MNKLSRHVVADTLAETEQAKVSRRPTSTVVLAERIKARLNPRSAVGLTRPSIDAAARVILEISSQQRIILEGSAASGTFSDRKYYNDEVKRLGI